MVLAMVARRPVVASKLWNQPDELFDDCRIVERAFTRSEDLDRLVVSHSWPVRTVGGQGVEALHDRQDPGAEGNFGSYQTIGIAAAVPSFVVVPHDWHNRIGKVDRGQNSRAHRRVLL